MKINDYYSHKLSKIKNNRSLVVIYFVIIPVTLVAAFLQSINYLASLFSASDEKPSIVNNYYDIKNEGITDSVYTDKTFNYLLFRDFESFSKWNLEVNFRMGLPKSGRNLLSQKIDSEVRSENYSKYKGHPDKKDKRVICGADHDLPKDLLDENAEREYKFIKITIKEAEEMGFINDEPEDDTLNIISFNITKVAPFREGITVRPALNYIFYPENCIDAILKLHAFAEDRNKYILDFGSQLNSNRLSLYLDKSNNLCFRFIDSISRICGIKINTDALKDYFHIHCKFATNRQMAYMEIYINGQIVAQKEFYSKIIYGDQINVFSTMGSNLNGEYCGGFECRHLYGYQNYLEHFRYFIKFNADDTKNITVINGKVAKAKAD